VCSDSGYAVGERRHRLLRVCAFPTSSGIGLVLAEFRSRYPRGSVSRSARQSKDAQRSTLKDAFYEYAGATGGAYHVVECRDEAVGGGLDAHLRPPRACRGNKGVAVAMHAPFRAAAEVWSTSHVVIRVVVRRNRYRRTLSASWIVPRSRRALRSYPRPSARGLEAKTSLYKTAAEDKLIEGVRVV
jgi:hypothetical protein